MIFNRTEWNKLWKKFTLIESENILNAAVFKFSDLCANKVFCSVLCYHVMRTHIWFSMSKIANNNNNCKKVQDNVLPCRIQYKTTYIGVIIENILEGILFFGIAKSVKNFLLCWYLLVLIQSLPSPPPPGLSREPCNPPQCALNLLY